MDVSVRHLQGPARVDVGQLEGAVIARFAVGGIGQMEGDWTFFALGVDDAEASVDGRGGASRQGALGDVDTDRGDRRGARIERDCEVFAFSNALGHLDERAGCESDGSRGGRTLLG